MNVYKKTSGICHVVVSIPISQVAKRRIRAVSPRVELVDVSDLAFHELTKGNPALVEKWCGLFKVMFGVAFNPEKVGANGYDGPDAPLAKADVFFGIAPLNNLTGRAPRLKWIHVPVAGADHFLKKEIVESPVLLTNTRIHSTAVGEFVLWLMLMLAKQGISSFPITQGKQWKPFSPMLLRSRTVGIIGLGNIGEEVARLSKAFGMRVIGTRRSAVRKPTKYVDQILPRKRLHELLSESDFVILTLPLTSETEKMIGENELRMMRPTAYLINVARGRIVNEPALIKALEERWIAGAGLDAFVTEPLPLESRLWDLPNVIITPHVAGNMENYQDLAIELFCENLRRYLSDERLLNIVDKKRGY
jgi:D-2-hydroxyacid dehydrogenase (NADP+)